MKWKQQSPSKALGRPLLSSAPLCGLCYCISYQRNTFCPRPCTLLSLLHDAQHGLKEAFGWIGGGEKSKTQIRRKMKPQTRGNAFKTTAFIAVEGVIILSNVSIHPSIHPSSVGASHCFPLCLCHNTSVDDILE